MSQEIKRIVVKVGTSTLTYPNGKTNLRHMSQLAAVLSDIMNSGCQVVLVSSGAIGVGVGKLGLKEKPKDTQGRQAAASVPSISEHISLVSLSHVNNSICIPSDNSDSASNAALFLSESNGRSTSSSMTGTSPRPISYAVASLIDNITCALNPVLHLLRTLSPSPSTTDIVPLSRSTFRLYLPPVIMER